MAEYQAKSVSWSEDLTTDPSVSVIAEDVPRLTVATILGVTVVVLIAIVAVFVLGVLIDCRQKRLIDKKISQVKRLKKRKGNGHKDTDGVAITSNMEEPGMSLPPAEILRHIP